MRSLRPPASFEVHLLVFEKVLPAEQSRGWLAAMDTLPRGVPEWAMTALVVVLVFYGVFPNGNLPPAAASLSSIDSSRRGDAAAAAAAAATIHHIGSPVPLINGPASKSSHDVIADIKARRHHEEA